MFSLTRTALEQFDNQHDFERMCADILNAIGYRDVVLTAPRGGSDGGRDITFTNEDGGKGLACITLRKDSDKKFDEDFSQRSKGEFDKYFFFTNQYLTADQKKKYIRFCLDLLDAQLIPQDIEALRSLLDSVLKQIREVYLQIKNDSIGVKEEDLAALRDEIGRRNRADLLLLRAYQFATDLQEKAGLIEEAVELYPPCKQVELRKLGIEMSIAVIDGYDPTTQMGRQMASVIRSTGGYPVLERVDMEWLTTNAINYLRDNVLNAATPDSEGLLYLACMYGYQQQFDEMMKVIDQSLKIDEEIKYKLMQRKNLLTLLHATGSDQMKLERVRKKLEIPSFSKETFCQFVQNFNVTDFSDYIDWIAIKRPSALGERGTFLIRINSANVQNNGLVSASALSVSTWQNEPISNNAFISSSDLYDLLDALFFLIYPSERV